MLSNETVITPPQDESLVTVYETRLALNLMTSTDETLMDQLELIIDWSSGEIATLCNRVFGRMTVTETFREVLSNRLYLSHWPIFNIASVSEDSGTSLVAGVDYEVDKEAGRLMRLDADWMEPITVTYTGGYELPHDSPKGLRHATLLMAREAYFAMTRGDATIRMLSHKNTRVIYFDPNARSGAAGGGGSSGFGGSQSGRAVADLLKRYTRFCI